MFSTTSKPQLTIDNVKDLVSRLFGLEATNIVELNGYDDKNFKIEINNNKEISNKFINQPAHPHGYVLKVSNALASKNLQRIECQNNVLFYLFEQNNELVQIPMATINGNFMEIVNLPHKNQTTGDVIIQEHVVRLLTFIPGEVLNSVPLSIQLCEKLGKFAGQLTIKLQNIPNKNDFPRDLTVWNLSRVLDLWDYIPFIVGNERQTIVRKSMELFQQKITSSEHLLLKGIIHGDLNHYNILVKKIAKINHEETTSSYSADDDDGDDDDGDDDEWEICGLLDWQDMANTFVIYELALLLMYVLLSAESTSMEIISYGKAIICGYLSIFSHLTKVDIDLLPVLVLARLAQSLCIGEYQSRVLQPGNEYTLASAHFGWNLIQFVYDNLNSFQNAWKMDD